MPYAISFSWLWCFFVLFFWKRKNQLCLSFWRKPSTVDDKIGMIGQLSRCAFFRFNGRASSIPFPVDQFHQIMRKNQLESEKKIGSHPGYHLPSRVTSFEFNVSFLIQRNEKKQIQPANVFMFMFHISKKTRSVVQELVLNMWQGCLAQSTWPM